MAIFKCKMCGGDLILSSDSTIAECEYCGSVQTVPAADNDKKMTLFARANRLRYACEFDKAAGVYEAIVADFPEEAEAYWGLVLCKYGIEYVDDPVTAKKVPTCHRSSFDSLMDDSDYEQALENADVIARRIYREEAKQIEDIRKRIIEVSSGEDPYDIFICYKETDELGNRTLDSVLAQDLYDVLTSRGYKVFFSRITLEDKLGQEYEPYIFAALHSAKIMLVVGTDYEHFNAVWVKNEWSRFLHLISSGEKKVLIPCFKNLDAYDMPKEFAKLQAQDLGKVGALQDLLRGIEKILPLQKPTITFPQMPVNALIERGMLLLEDGEWENAEHFFNDVLDMFPKSAEAYLGKLMVSLRVRTESELSTQPEPFDGNSHYQKVLRFAQENLRNRIHGYNEQIIYRKAEATRLEEQRRIEYARQCEEARLAEICEAEMRQAQHKAYLQSVRERIKPAQGMLAATHKQSFLVNWFGKVFSNNTHNHKFWCADYDVRSISAEHAECDSLIQKSRSIFLRYDGTVILWDDDSNACRNLYPFYKRNVQSISMGKHHQVALLENGTVLANGKNNVGQCNVGGWRDIVAVSAGETHTVGLTKDGYVVFTGQVRLTGGNSAAEQGQAAVSISASGRWTMGLRDNGTVWITNRGSTCYSGLNWDNIVAISMGGYHFVGLRADGTVVAGGTNDYGQCDVSDWKNIVAIAAGTYHTLGVQADGYVVATGLNKHGQCNVSGIQLFGSIDSLQWEKDVDGARIRANQCRSCGGKFKGVFNPVCTVCEKKKDYKGRG